MIHNQNEYITKPSQFKKKGHLLHVKTILDNLKILYSCHHQYMKILELDKTLEVFIFSWTQHMSTLFNLGLNYDN